jgi:chromosome segregation ATPase
MGTAYSTESDPNAIIQKFEDEIKNLKNTIEQLEEDLQDFKNKNRIDTENLLIDLELYKMKLSKQEELEKELENYKSIYNKQLENATQQVEEYKGVIYELKEEISQYKKEDKIKEELNKIILDLKSEIEFIKNSKTNNSTKSEVEYYMKKYVSAEEENNRLKKHIQVYQALLENNK